MVVATIAELPVVQRPALPVPLPPSSPPLPREQVHDALRAYRSGDLDVDALIAIIDQCGEQLETPIADAAVQELDDFRWAIQHAARAHDRLTRRLAQAAWLRAFPHGADAQPHPLTVAFGPRRAEVPVTALLDALGQLRIDERLVAQAASHRAEI